MKKLLIFLLSMMVGFCFGQNIPSKNDTLFFEDGVKYYVPRYEDQLQYLDTAQYHTTTYRNGMRIEEWTNNNNTFIRFYYKEENGSKKTKK